MRTLFLRAPAVEQLPDVRRQVTVEEPRHTRDRMVRHAPDVLQHPGHLRWPLGIALHLRRSLVHRQEWPTLDQVCQCDHTPVRRHRRPFRYAYQQRPPVFRAPLAYLDGLPSRRDQVRPGLPDRQRLDLTFPHESPTVAPAGNARLPALARSHAARSAAPYAPLYRTAITARAFSPSSGLACEYSARST